jgi:hypothetical protein
MDTQRGQKPEGRSERQRPRLLQSPDRWDAKAARTQAKDKEGRREAKVFLLSHGRHEEETYFGQDSERPEQPYKQEP